MFYLRAAVDCSFQLFLILQVHTDHPPSSLTMYNPMNYFQNLYSSSLGVSKLIDGDIIPQHISS